MRRARLVRCRAGQQARASSAHLGRRHATRRVLRRRPLRGSGAVWDRGDADGRSCSRPHRAETVNGLYKTELIRAQGPWRTADQVELATAAWWPGGTPSGSTPPAATSRRPSSRPPTITGYRRPRPPETQSLEPPPNPVRFMPSNSRVLHSDEARAGPAAELVPSPDPRKGAVDMDDPGSERRGELAAVPGIVVGRRASRRDRLEALGLLLGILGVLLIVAATVGRTPPV